MHTRTHARTHTLLSLFYVLGHKTYLGFLYLTLTYNNPVVHTFVRLLREPFYFKHTNNLTMRTLHCEESFGGDGKTGCDIDNVMSSIRYICTALPRFVSLYDLLLGKRGGGGMTARQCALPPPLPPQHVRILVMQHTNKGGGDGGEGGGLACNVGKITIILCRKFILKEGGGDLILTIILRKYLIY